MNKLSEYKTFTYQNTLLHTPFCLFLKLSKTFIVSLIKLKRAAVVQDSNAGASL